MLVLIVEDDPLIGLDLRDELLAAGYHVAGPACHEREALELATDLHPEVALVDIDLHGGQEGLQLARTLRAHSGAPVSGSRERAAAIANSDAALGSLPKPYTHRDIISVIELVADLGSGREPSVDQPRTLELFA